MSRFTSRHSVDMNGMSISYRVGFQPVNYLNNIALILMARLSHERHCYKQIPSQTHSKFGSVDRHVVEKLVDTKVVHELLS